MVCSLSGGDANDDDKVLLKKHLGGLGLGCFDW